MKTLVLGGSGFIGSHLVDRLQDEKHDVAVLDVVKSAKPGVESYVGQLEDSDILAQAVAGRDVVFHLVSTTVPATSNKNVEFDISSNLVSLVRLLELMRAHGVGRIVYLSSGGAVYGNPKEYPIAEEHPLDPISSYGIVKLAAEKYLYMYQQLYGLQPLVIRPANAYGPGQNILKPQGVIGHFLASAIRGKQVQIWGDGSVRRDYIFVSDLVELILAAVRREATGVFNAGSGSDVSLNEIVQVVEGVIGDKLSVEHVAARSYDVRQVRLDIAKAKEQFGWCPEVQLEQGVRRQWLAMQSPSGNQTRPAT